MKNKIHKKSVSSKTKSMIGALVLCCIWSASEALTTPLNPAVQRLSDSLTSYESLAKKPWQTLHLTQNLSLGQEDPEVPLLRARLCQYGDIPAAVCEVSTNAQHYDESLEKGVIHFQERHGVVADGVVGPKTLHALNVSPAQRVHQIQINLKRWHHLIALAEPNYIWVNVPDHRLRLVHNHQAVFIARVIVGKPSRQTPEIHSEVTRVVLNPYWVVPPGIARRDILPKALKDPSFLTRSHIRVFSAQAPQRELDPSQVDWATALRYPGRYVLRQDPGPHNALGQIKFLFSNRHLVYLHDTPTKHLFDQPVRLFSSGCVRMEDPFDFLHALTRFDSSLASKVAELDKHLESGKQVAIHLQQPVPIHITYLTAWTDPKGVIHFWDDVYSLDPVFTHLSDQDNQEDYPNPV
jgi:L,D-transpeptidase YcbB